MKASSPRSIRWRQESRSPNGSKVFRDERLNAGASVYHYLEYPHALSVFSEGRLRLANPLTWSDPYENWWNKTLFDRPSPLQQARPYALCWTRSRFDGPAWRMTGFQRTNPIVRIRCRVRDLLAAAQRMLLRLGIASTIHHDRRPPGSQLLPDGRGGQRWYETAAPHELAG